MGIEKALAVKPGSVNGLKMILGAALIVFAGEINVMNDLIVALPTYSEQLQQVIGWLKAGMKVSQWGVEVLGGGFMGVGVVHKLLKLIGKD